LINSYQNGHLIWNESKGFGIDATRPIKYDASYFEKYVELDKTNMAERLTKARISLVERHTVEKPIDIGIGGGKFCKDMGAHGYDVNPLAVQWLKANGKYKDPYKQTNFCLTFWDSLEHIDAPSALLKLCTGFVFVSIPIFESRDHCLKSKHFKPGEHIWHFTHDGFIDWMEDKGFIMLEYNNMESTLGREGIVSYAFMVKKHANATKTNMLKTWMP